MAFNETKFELGDGEEKVVSLTLFRANRERRESSNNLKVTAFGVTTQEKQRCLHRQVSLDTTHAELKCDTCEMRLNPIEWISNLVDEWHYIQRGITRWHDARRAAKAEQGALELKQRAKCQHCGKMTRVRGDPATAREIFKTT